MSGRRDDPPRECPPVLVLRQFVDEEVPAQERGGIDEHISSCPHCQQKLDQLVLSEPGLLGAALAPRRHPQTGPADDGPPHLDGYEPLGRIDAGGMGVVWRVRDVRFQRPLAIKVLKAKACDNPNAVRRFFMEAQIMGQLAHPFIVPIHAMGELPDGRPYYTMKLVEGKTLAKLLYDPASRPMELVQVFAQVCQAVAFAHSRGIVHRDLKPANVMVGAHDEVQVMDWGLVKVLDDTAALQGEVLDANDTADDTGHETSGRTRTGSVLGTWAFMPPEQARGLIDEVDKQSDVFGLGAILCQALTGQPPYVGPDAESIEVQAKEARLDGALSRLRDCGAGPELIQLAERCLSASKSERPADAGEVAAAVAAYQALVQERLHQERLERERQQVRAAEEGQRRKLWMGLAAAVLAALGVSVGFAIFQRQAASELRASLSQTRRVATLSTWDRGRTMCEEGEVGHGLLLIAQALAMAPSGPEDANLRDALRIEVAGWLPHCHTLCQVWPHPDKVLALAVSPDGKTAVTGCADGKVRLWDLNAPGPRGHCRRELAGHRGAVCAAGFSSHGDTFITGGTDGKAYLWNAATGQLLGPLEGEHPGGACSVALSPDGKLALTGGADKLARIWALPARTCQTILEHPGPVLTVAFSPDGRTFFTGGEKEDKKGEARLYTIPAVPPREPSRLPLQYDKASLGGIQSAGFSLDGKTLLIGDDNWKAWLWDVKSGKRFAALDRINGYVRGVAFAPRGKTVLTGAHESAAAHLWNVQALRGRWKKQRRQGVVEGTRPLNPPLPHPSPVTAVSFGLDEKQILTASEDGYVRVWKKAPGNATTRLSHLPRGAVPQEPDNDNDGATVAFAPCGRRVVTAGWDNQARLWKVPNGKEDGTLSHTCRIRVAAFASGGTVVTGDTDHQVCFWDLRTRQIVGAKLQLPDKKLSWLRLSRTGGLALTGYEDGTAQLWDTMRRKPLLRQPLRHSSRGKVTVLAISPDERKLLTGGEDSWARIWDASGKMIGKLPHQGTVWDVKFSPDGNRVVTASHDGAVRIWDTDTGELLVTLTHRSSVNAFAFVPGGKRLLTASRDEGVQLWDIQLRRRVGPNCRPSKEAEDVALSPDGTIAALVDRSGYGLLWHLSEPVREDNPEQITLRVQAAVGMRLDEAGGRQVLEGRSWLGLQKRLE